MKNHKHRSLFIIQLIALFLLPGILISCKTDPEPEPQPSIDNAYFKAFDIKNGFFQQILHDPIDNLLYFFQVDLADGSLTDVIIYDYESKSEVKRERIKGASSVQTVRPALGMFDNKPELYIPKDSFIYIYDAREIILIDSIKLDVPNSLQNVPFPTWISYSSSGLIFVSYCQFSQKKAQVYHRSRKELLNETTFGDHCLSFWTNEDVNSQITTLIGVGETLFIEQFDKMGNSIYSLQNHSPKGDIHSSKFETHQDADFFINGLGGDIYSKTDLSLSSSLKDSFNMSFDDFCISKAADTIYASSQFKTFHKFTYPELVEVESASINNRALKIFRDENQIILVYLFLGLGNEEIYLSIF